MVANTTKSHAHFTKRGSAMDVSVYCDPTTAMMKKPTRASTQNASSSVHKGTTTGAHFTKQGSSMDVEVYCDPTTSMMRKPRRASTPNADSIVHGGTTVGVQSTKRGLTTDVDEYCEPTTAMIKKPTQTPTDLLEGEDGYLACALIEKFTKERQEKMPLGFSNMSYDTQIGLLVPDDIPKKLNVSISISVYDTV